MTKLLSVRATVVVIVVQVENLGLTSTPDLRPLVLLCFGRCASKSLLVHKGCGDHSAHPLPLGQASLTLPWAGPIGLVPGKGPRKMTSLKNQFLRGAKKGELKPNMSFF